MRVTFPHTSLGSWPMPTVAAGQASRTMTGLAAPWGEEGFTSAGKLIFQRGSLRLPTELSRVKLVDYHQTPPQAIGYATSAQDTEHGLVMAFQLGSTAAASQALVEASEGLRDAFSVELGDYDAPDGLTVVDGLVTAVALVPIPAFANARVTSVAAAHHDEGNSTMTDTQASTEPQATAAATQTIAVTGPVVEAPAPAPAPDEQAADAAQVQAAFARALRGDNGAAALLASLVGADSGPARRPDELSGPHSGGRVTSYGRADVEAALSRVIRGESRHPSLEAALSDVINTNVYEVVGQDSYVGQLWSAKTYSRRFVPLLRQAALTSWRVRGWKWGTRPGGAAYAGDKAAIPSNSPTVLPAEEEATRWAGGHDLDIKFKHFGDTEFLNAYATAMTEDYAVDSDAVARAFILASASTPTGWDTLGAGKSLIYGAMLAGDLMSEQLDQDVEPDYYIVSRADFRAIIDLVEDDKPAFMAAFGVDPSKFIRSSAQTTGIITAGLTGAGTWYELGGSPIRMEALDLVKGGVDEAFFGYHATLLHDDRGIVKVDITA
jgi:hypothetical protein